MRSMPDAVLSKPRKLFGGKQTLLAISVLSVLGISAARAEVMTLKGVAQKAVVSNPEVLAKYHVFIASEGEQQAVASALLPHVDYIAAKGRYDYDQPGLVGKVTESSQTLQLTQLLWDGLGSWYQKRQFDHARVVRLFEFFDASESVALEVARAYFDVQRYRKLVALAEDNYVQHRSVFEQIEAKVKAGVGRRVDFEQASGRLALAESNLIVEIANLHDVSARFQRLVGQPPEEMEVAPPLAEPQQMTANQVLESAYSLNPQVRAAVENVRASAYARDARRGAYQPKVELRLRDNRGSDLGGGAGNTHNQVAEVLLNFNLFNGFGDKGRVDQAVGLYDAARDQRDKACRDVRQTVEIAYNDVRKLSEQKKYLEEHRLSVEKARDAYRKQFDIGQRSLLDLLDTENELFQARRAEVGADFDLSTAHARVQAAQGKLLATLGLSSIDNDLVKETAGWNLGKESPEQCPPIPVATYVVDKEQLNQRATELTRDKVKTMLDAIAERKYAQTGSVPAAIVVENAANPSAPAAPTAPSGAAKELLLDVVDRWVRAWAARDVKAYQGFYAESFAPADGRSRDSWARDKQALIERSGEIKINLSNQVVEMRSETHATTRFHQRYRSGIHADEINKTLDWQLIDGQWRIVRETASALPKPVKP